MPKVSWGWSLQSLIGGLLFPSLATALGPPNIYHFHFPPGSVLAQSGVEGNEIWNRKQLKETVLIARFSDLQAPVTSEDQARNYLRDLIEVRKRARVGLATEHFRIDHADYRWDQGHQGWIFEIRGVLPTTLGMSLRFIEREYLVKREA